MSGLFSLTPAASTRRLPGEEEDTANLPAESWSDGERSRWKDARRLARLEGREDTSPGAEWPEAFEAERHDDILTGSDGDDTLTGTGGTLDERPPSSIAPPPKPTWMRARSNDNSVSTSIPRKMPQGQPPAVPAMPAGDGPGSREFKQFILPEFERVMKITAKHEGGLAPDGTYKGLDQDALNKLVKQDPDRWAAVRDMTSAEVKAIPSKNIPDDVRRGIYYWNYFSGPQLDLLAAIPGLAETEPQLAAQMFDAQVLPFDDAHQWLKESLNEAALPADKLNPDEVKKIVDREAVTFGIPTTPMVLIEKFLPMGADGMFKLQDSPVTGAITRAVVKIALDAGKISEVNDRLLDKRFDAILKNPKLPANPGWPPRGRSYLSNGPASLYGPYGKNGIRPY